MRPSSPNRRAAASHHAAACIRRWRIGTVNSINWARLLAQVVYYFAGYFQATRTNDERVSFAVPSGNFGNICAGHVARMMGLPIRKLVVATNENDVLDEFFRTGVYRVRGSAETHETSSPSMDISKASNFERFVFDLLGRDGARTPMPWDANANMAGFTSAPDAWLARLPGVGGLRLHKAAASLLIGAASSVASRSRRPTGGSCWAPATPSSRPSRRPRSRG